MDVKKEREKEKKWHAVKPTDRAPKKKKNPIESERDGRINLFLFKYIYTHICIHIRE